MIFIVADGFHSVKSFVIFAGIFLEDVTYVRTVADLQSITQSSIIICLEGCNKFKEVLPKLPKLPVINY